MDNLQKAAVFFKYISENEFKFVLGSKGKQREIVISASEDHFPHLVGLDKLIDIKNSIFRTQGKKEVLARILSGDLGLELIEKSSFFINDEFHQSIENRISFFSLLRPMFTNGDVLGEANFVFLKKNAYSSINANYLFRLQIKSGAQVYYLNLFLKRDESPGASSNHYIPISFFPRTDNKYETKQQSLTVLFKLRKKEDETEVLYTRNGFTPTL